MIGQGFIEGLFGVDGDEVNWLDCPFGDCEVFGWLPLAAAPRTSAETEGS